VKVRLYLDEDAADSDFVYALRSRRVDVESAHEADMLSRADVEHLAYATTQGRVLFTFNTGHFCRLHAEFRAAGKPHAGIVVSRQQHYSVGEQMRRLLKLIARKTAEEMQNQLEFLSQWG